MPESRFKSIRHWQSCCSNGPRKTVILKLW